MVVREVNGIIVLTPDAGRVLRRVDAEPGESGASEVWLAPADSRDDWEDVDPSRPTCSDSVDGVPAGVVPCC